jgi:hypothetical protein
MVPCSSRGAAPSDVDLIWFDFLSFKQKSDDTSIFIRAFTGPGSLKTNDQSSRITYENVRFNKHHIKNPIVILG